MFQDTLDRRATRRKGIQEIQYVELRHANQASVVIRPLHAAQFQQSALLRLRRGAISQHSDQGLTARQIKPGKETQFYKKTCFVSVKNVERNQKIKLYLAGHSSYFATVRQDEAQSAACRKMRRDFVFRLAIGAFDFGHAVRQSELARNVGHFCDAQPAQQSIDFGRIVRAVNADSVTGLVLEIRFLFPREIMQITAKEIYADTSSACHFTERSKTASKVVFTEPSDVNLLRDLIAAGNTALLLAGIGLLNIKSFEQT